MQIYLGKSVYFCFDVFRKFEHILPGSMVEVEEEIAMVFGYLDATDARSFESCLIDESSGRVSCRIFEK